jgi:Xaa-Pro aminopeptidase
MLEQPEIDWLNDYHAEVQLKLLPLVKQETKEWLIRATANLQ